MCLLISLAGWSQPVNDNCGSAQPLNLSTPPACPSTSPVTNTYNVTNIDATPTSPYPQFSDCQVGGATDAPAAEVWFRFVPHGNTLTISINGGLNTPNIVLFSGTDCTFLTPVYCASSAPNAGSLTVTIDVLANQPYYLFVSGGDINDQGNFQLSFTTSNSCNPCLLGNVYTASPPPLNGTYNSGQTVTFCFTVTQWDVTGTIEWLHAIEINPGPGWDLSSLNPVPPPSCDGGGQWGFYDSWVGQNTGMVFGPGFAYDSSFGGPLDGNPGNNWGDGANGCANIGTSSPPKTFCWTITASDCPPNATGNSLSMSVQVWSDGDSGSWTQTGCNSGVTFNFLATTICCDDLPPTVIPVATSCPGEDDGSVQIIGGGGPGTIYNFYFFNNAGSIISTCLGCPGPLNLSNLEAGTYSILATNIATNCSRSTPVIIQDGVPPQAQITLLNQPCVGGSINLAGMAIPAGPGITYEWTGPGGYFSTLPNPPPGTFAGTYQLVVYQNGCPSEPATINVQFTQVSVTASANPQQVCEGGTVTLSANGANSYTWVNTTTGQPAGSGPSITVTAHAGDVYQVTGNGANGCTGTASPNFTVNPLPTVNINSSGSFCPGQPLILTATGANTYQWADDPGAANPRLVMLTPGPHTFNVTGTILPSGCSSTGSINLFILPPAVASISPGSATICPGESVTLTASGGTGYMWSNSGNTAAITVSPTTTTTYTVTVTNEDDCTDTESVTVTVTAPIPAPVVSCGTTTPNSVQFTWPPVPSATSYTVVVNSGPTGTLLGTTYTVNNLSPGQTVTITVTPHGMGNCVGTATTFSCSAQNCTPVDVEISPIADYCLSNTLTPDTLSVAITGGMNGDTLWSGPGIVNAQLGVFDPVVADTGAHQIIVTYTEGLCIFRDTIVINVYPIPIADFSFTGNNPLCIGDTLVFNYTGDADTSATYNWDFGDGIATPGGTAQGPQTVTWNNAGGKLITLIVSANGCTSDTAATSITVDGPLLLPSITCGPATTTSVTFNWTDVAGATGYTVAVLTGQSGTQSGNSYTVNNLMPGETVTIEVTAETDNACGPVTAQATCNAADCPNFTINISPVSDICLGGATVPLSLNATVTGGTGGGARTWSGPGIIDAANGTFDPSVAGVGSHTITLTYAEGPCSEDASITIDVFDTPTADFTVTQSDICINQTIVVSYNGTADPNTATFNWNFNGGTATPGTGAGPHTVSWPTAGSKVINLSVTENGCTSQAFSQTVQVSAPLSAPVINCSPSTSEIVFTWNNVPGASSYNVTVITGPTGVQNGNTYTVSGLSPGDMVTIRVEAVSTGPCGNSSAQQTCTAEDCPMVNITIDPVSAICLDATAAPITLNAQITGGAGGGTITWSGPGITDAANGTFDPTVAGQGTHTINLAYQEGNCNYNASIDIVVNPQPTANFTAPAALCTGQNGTIAYTGSAGGSATFDWDFGGGSATPGTGQGPHQVNWPTAGPATVSLVVTENGCASESFDATIQIDAPLAAPVITCTTTNTEITFSWMDVPGATGYNVTVISGPTGTQNGNSYTVSGLNPGDNATIEVTALNNGPCGNSSAQQTCTAMDCPNVTLDITSLDIYCTNDALQPLVVAASGGAGGGTVVWAGPGVVLQAGNYFFDPSTAGAGTHTLNVTYSEGVCDYMGSTMVTVKDLPTADFTVESPVCVDAPATVTFTGANANGSTFVWDFDGGTANPGTGMGPHEVTWSTPGTKTISLTVDNNTCPVSSTQTVEVEAPLTAPVISCTTTNTSITFSWPDVTGASGYDVTVISGPTGTLSGNTYSVTGLNPGDNVTIEVTALNNGPCGPVSAQQTCTAMDCPAVELMVTPIANQCNNAAQVALQVTATGGAGGGSILWTGQGIVLVGSNFFFDPTEVAPGAYTLTVTYTEGVCEYTATTDVTVNAVPTANFTVDTPVCTDSSATVTFTGTATVGAIYNWDFGGGAAIPGAGAGPHEVTWATSGTKTISLNINDNGCTANFSASVVVEPRLAAPVVTCQQTTSTSIVFSWAAVPGATGYQVVDVDGPTGTLSGTTYTVTGLSPNQSVTINVIAQGNGPCGNSMGTGTCIAQDCPSVTLALSGAQAICSGQAATVSFDFTGASGPFDVVYTVNSGSQQTVTLNDGGSINLGAIGATTTLTVLSFTDTNLPDCTYPGNASLMVTVGQPANTGTALAPVRQCVSATSVVTLANLLSGANAGGQWSEVSVTPSTGGAFNAAAGTFNPAGQAPGTYRFRYFIDAPDPCADAQTEVEVVIEPAPVADAGTDQTLICNQGMASIGGPNTSTGTGITYTWTASDPNIMISNPNAAIIEASQPGTYTLTVANDLGCSATDAVTIDANLEVPTAQVNLSEITCFQANDGAIQVANVSGGTPPYMYSLNGGAFSNTTQFSSLGPNSYSLVIRDQNGCFSELIVDITQPEELVVQLVTNLEGNNRTIELGDSVRLEALVNPGVVLDTIIWKPDTIAVGNEATLWVSPTGTTQYTVTVVDQNGCSDSDNTTIFVRVNRPIYIPNAFSPNDDGVNDIFYISARDNQVRQVKAFLVFDRWGETMIELYGFQPNDPAYGWNGKYRDKLLNPGVYTYFAEIEFTDGAVILYKGDVSLLR